MNLVEMYEHLKATGYVIDQYAFDREWLGRKPGYTAYIRSTSQAPSIETLFKIYLRLMDQGEQEAKLGLGGLSLLDMAEGVFIDMCERTQV